MYLHFVLIDIINFLINSQNDINYNFHKNHIFYNFELIVNTKYIIRYFNHNINLILKI